VAADLDEIFRGSYGRLVTGLYALTGNLTEAQDVVSEAFVRAVSFREKVLDASSAEAWLFTVARNIARSRWRRTVRLSQLLLRVEQPEPPPELQPDRIVLVEAIRQLPAVQREAIAMHHLMDVPVSEVAIALGVSVNTVKSRLTRGRAALAAMLGDSATTRGSAAC
jgi:RNA polymerase sigma-70 factor (ECF subfamily)